MPGFKGRRVNRKKLKVTASKKQKSNAIEQVKVKNIKRIVRAVVNKDEEVKCATYQIWQQNVVQGTGLNVQTGYGLTTSGLSGAPSGIVPAIGNGTGRADRIGANIRPTSFFVKFGLRALDTTGNTTGTNPFKGKPMLVRVLIYNHRYATDDYDNTNILDKGATTGNIDSLTDSWFEKYNKKEYIIHWSKTYKMSALVDTGGATPSVENSPNGFSNYINRTAYIKVPKKLMYNGATNLPSAFAPKMAVCVCNLDGTGASLTNFRIQVNAESRLYYYDA